MDLTQISNHELLNRVEKLSRTERKITHLILCHLVEVETRRLHLDLGYTSLFRYMTTHLHYSEDAAYRRIQAARLLKKLPQLEKSLESGEVNLTQLQQVQKCLNKEREQGHKVTIQQTQKVLEQIQNKSSFETQKILAVEFNQSVQHIESLTSQRDDSVRIELTLSEDQMQKLQHAKELLSHVLPNPTWAELIAYLATAQVEKRLGKEKVKTEFKNNEIIKSKPTKKETTAKKGSSKNRETSNLKSTHRPHIKITTRRALFKKAQHQCEYIDATTGRCPSKFQLQVDHQRPLALGGTNEFSNLRILCQQHNLSEARRWGISRL